jgi:hypothetical protein
MSNIEAVALGQSPVKTMQMGLGGGTVTVDASDGAISVKTPNISYSHSLGTVTYEMMDEREIIYENSGVWSRYPSGGSVGVSSPKISLSKDFNNKRYLTISVIEINSSLSSTGGKGIISLRNRAKRFRATSNCASAWENYFNWLNDSAGGGVGVTSSATTCNTTVQYDQFMLNNHTVNVRV